METVCAAAFNPQPETRPAGKSAVRPAESESVDRARTIIDNLTTAVLLLGTDLRVLAMNPAAEELFEVSANQVLGTSVERLFAETASFATALGRAAEERRRERYR